MCRKTFPYVSGLVEHSENQNVWKACVLAVHKKEQVCMCDGVP